MQNELKETLRTYSPERFKDLAAQLENMQTELNLTKSQLKTSQLAQKQQHKLVVSWRIKVPNPLAR